MKDTKIINFKLNKTFFCIYRLVFVLFLSLSTVCCLLSTVFADVKIHPNAGTTSAAFLKLGLGSRAISMSGTFVGLADDVSALYWNPAGLVRLNKRELNITHNESFEGIRHDFVGYAHILEDYTLAGAVYGLYTPKDFERRSGFGEDDPFNPFTPVEGYFRAYDLALHVSYSKWLKERLSGGASFKVIQQTIDNQSAYGVAVDLGTLYDLSNLPLSVGFVLQNIGTPIKFENKGYYPPFNVKLGGAWRWNKNLVTTLDLNKPIDNFFFISVGAEYLTRSFLSLRAGYRYRQYGLELDDLSGLSAGVGLSFSISDMDFRFDYAFTPYGVLGNSQRFSLSTFFGPERSKEKKYKAPKKKKPKTPKKTKIHDGKPQSSSLELSGYSLHATEILSELKMATGRVSVYSLLIKSKDSVLYYIEGIARAPVIKNLQIQIAEKSESDRVKHFMFEQNLPISIQNAQCRIRVPKSSGSISIKTDDGSVIDVEKLSENENSVDYKFSMEFLKPFKVERENPANE
ncbi:MAG: PorV/PorQ family protein [Endomicrobiales bacterium]|nr:PorV/PorQ family protein [Endomicrobiales bacterium]